MLVGLSLFAQGCSEFEPRHGTKVTFVFDAGKPVKRNQLASVSKYFISRGRMLLGVNAPRVADYSKHSLVLLLPGKKVSKSDAQKLVQPYSIELYHLANVATESNPNRPWKIKVPSTPTGPYLFVGKGARLIDSHKDSADVRNEVLGISKPVLTGIDILPNASIRQIRDGWAVQVQFNKDGEKTFSDFTKANEGEYLAVFYNGRLVCAPIIKGVILGGKALITGFAKQKQADALVSELNAGRISTSAKIKSVTYY